MRRRILRHRDHDELERKAQLKRDGLQRFGSLYMGVNNLVNTKT